MEEFGIENKTKRPVFLTVLCILTLVCTGFNLLMLFFATIAGKPTPEKLEIQETQMLEAIALYREQGLDGFAQLFEQIAAMNVYTNQLFYTMATVNILTVLLGLFGAVAMLKGRKIGFHFYIIYSLASVASVYIAVPVQVVPAIFPISNLIVGGIFILMYSRNLKWLR